MTHLSWITNIPTPYRNHRYELMQEVFPGYGLTFEVLYMAWSEPSRHWKFDSSELRYPHTVFPGIHPTARNVNLHFNPGLLRHLRKRKPDIAVVGGLSAPTLAAAPFVCPASTTTLLGVESNLDSITYRRGMFHRFKQSLVRQYDGFVGPGKPSRDYVESLDPDAARKPFIFLPNIVDSAFFAEQGAASGPGVAATRHRYGIPPNRQLWLTVARLEEIKGLDIFLPLLEGIGGIQLLVAGDGSQRRHLQSLISRHGLPVDLIGQLDAAALRDLYAAADLFVLPSLRDPSPLSAVEAAASKLPLLLSQRAGNAEDLVGDGQGGWLYDPARPSEMIPTLRAIASMTRQELEFMGQRSYSRYKNTFDSVRCIERLAEGLIAVRTEKWPDHE